MPLPLFLGIGAAFAAGAGIGTGIKGAMKVKDAKDKVKQAEKRHQRNIFSLKFNNTMTLKSMDRLGETELKILESFSNFAAMIEIIQNRPEFKPINVDDTEIPVYTPDELKTVSVGACTLLGGTVSAGLGTMGGFAAAGCTTAAVMALGTASTGAAISGLTGVAATNATLAALGGGAIAAGGGGMALGSIVLGGATLGVGLLVGGLIFNIAGSKLSDKADEAYNQMTKAEHDIHRIVLYLQNLREQANKYNGVLKQVERVYQRLVTKMEMIVVDEQKTDWNTFSDEEKKTVENCSYLVGLLYNMCKLQIVKNDGKSDCDNELKAIAYTEIGQNIDHATNTMSRLGYDLTEKHNE